MLLEIIRFLQLPAVFQCARQIHCALFSWAHTREWRQLSVAQCVVYLKPGKDSLWNIFFIGKFFTTKTSKPTGKRLKNHNHDHRLVIIIYNICQSMICQKEGRNGMQQGDCCTVTNIHACILIVRSFFVNKMSCTTEGVLHDDDCGIIVKKSYME